MKLPKPDALILGMLLDDPLSPYDMAKLAQTINPNYWITIAKQTFYVNVQRLAKKGLIEGHTIRQGKMPEKTLYTLTNSGKEAITKRFLDFLASDELDTEMFRLAIFLLAYIPVEREELYPYLWERITQLTKLDESLSQKMEVAQEQLPQEQLPLNVYIINKYTLQMIRYEIKIAEELRGVLEDDARWAFFTRLKLADFAKY